VRTCLKQFVQYAKETIRHARAESDWINKMRSEKQKFEQQIAKEGSTDSIPIKPQRLCKEIREFMPRDSIIILDGGDTSVWGLTYLRAYYQKHLYFSGGLFIQHLGGGVPMGLATKVANPDKKVLVLTGDGSFLFNGKEIESARRQDIPFVVVVANDRLWGMVARIQQIAYGKKYYGIGSKLSDKTRYDKYAEAFDCYGELVTDPKQIRPALQRAFDSKKPAVLDVRIDPNVMSVLDYVSATAYDPRTYERKIVERKLERKEEKVEKPIELVTTQP
jgi:thiamine pyrophosphate-dependent acetolactate synthase large subunit-like protein